MPAPFRTVADVTTHTTEQLKPGAADLNHPVWTVKHIALYLGIGRTAAYRLVATQGFPAPRDPLGGGDYRWLAEEVKAWFAGLGAAQPTAAPRFNPAPVARRRSAVAA